MLHRLTFGEAIEHDLLSDYQVVVVGVTDSRYRRWAERGEFVTLDGKQNTDARSLAGQIGLAKTMRSTTCAGSSPSTPGEGGAAVQRRECPR